MNFAKTDCEAAAPPNLNCTQERVHRLLTEARVRRRLADWSRSHAFQFQNTAVDTNGLCAT